MNAVWCIYPLSAVQSRKGDGQLTACEVTLVHHEDMGIPKDVAKLGVRHGMWGTVKKLHGGFRAYQVARKSEAPLSRSAQLAKITTKISIDGGSNYQESVSGTEEGNGTMDVQREGDRNGIDWKWLVVGGAVALACGLHTGVIGKAVLFGAGQRIARGRRGAPRR